MLKQRVITAVILALVVVGTVFLLDSVYLMILLAVMLGIAIAELVNMTVSKHVGFRLGLALAMAALFVYLRPQIGINDLFYLSYAGLIMWVMILLFMVSYRFSGQWSARLRLFVLVISALLLWVCVSGLFFIHAHYEQGSWILMYLLTLVWVADIGAYFTGKAFGKHKLAPGISPGKTWEGVLGGLGLNLLWISLVYVLSKGWDLTYVPFLLLGLVTAALSVVGDLYISILKREAGLKDSGSILPGHGGLLDRIDSVIAATPVYLAGLYMLGAV